MGEGISSRNTLSSAALALTATQMAVRLQAGGDQAARGSPSSSFSSATLVCTFGLEPKLVEGFDKGGDIF